MTSPSAPLSGRVAVVTGASSGIGEHVARALARDGAHVALLARRAERLKEICSRIEADGGQADVFTVDVTVASALDDTAQHIAATFGPVGIVVNNAGIMLPTPVTGSSAEDWSSQTALNVDAVNNTVRAFSGQLIEAAAAYGAADLVNTASIAGRTLFPSYSAYAATKAYVIHLGRNLRAELGPRQVRVTTIEPGIVDTELQSKIPSAESRGRLEDTRSQIEWLLPQDVADVVAYAVSLPPRVNLAEIAVLPTRQPA
ncbi:SDR family oxidoreductase [Streptomyces sp. W16]|uniref:SDR family oxidoreductase n=1 Tax=Streptomyces sp. W16 TaxID=3076631 RepID=UPI00295BAE90|nr:SDR family oxidoreductase [Streptomyces sp. W16]MDV9169008.1 SDR family oxidoreductase [Streptomyces sp. W16]